MAPRRPSTPCRRGGAANRAARTLLLVAHLTLEAVQVVIDVPGRRARRWRRRVPGVPEVVPQVIVVVVADLPPAVLVPDLPAVPVGGDLVHDVATTRDQGGDHDIAQHVEDEPNHATDDQEGY